MSLEETVVIDPRFQGIPEVALGGYVGGLLAGESRSAEAAFRRPVPLGRPLRVRGLEGNEVTFLDGDEVLTRVRPSPVEIRVPAPVTSEASRLASGSSPLWGHHLFPNCFTCGTSRSEGDGLRIVAGPVADRDVVASPWTPSQLLATPGGGVAAAFVWSALDCPSILALALQEPLESAERAVSARLAVQLLAPVTPLETYVVMGWAIGRDGRTRTGGAAILNSRGEVCAVARHTLAVTDWGVPLSMAAWK
jgi:hypothetical protein